MTPLTRAEQIEQLEMAAALMDSHAPDLRLTYSTWKPRTPISAAVWSAPQAHADHSEALAAAQRLYRKADALRGRVDALAA